MSVRSSLFFAAPLVVALGVAVSASAATITVLGDANSVEARRSLALDGLSLSAGFETVGGSRTGQYRDIFEGTGASGTDYFNLTAAPVWETVSVASVADRFRMLWGSPDTYNSLAFFLAGAEQVRYTGADLGDTPGVEARGAAYVEIADLSFDEVRFFTSGNAFEISNLSAAPVAATAAIPLPAAGLLLAAALAGVAALRRRFA